MAVAVGEEAAMPSIETTTTAPGYTTTPTSQSMASHRQSSTSSSSSTSTSSFVAECRQAGFDPFQLACTTCSLLVGSKSDDIHTKCRQCCQSWKSLDDDDDDDHIDDHLDGNDVTTAKRTKRNRRYTQAVLIHDQTIPGLFATVDDFLKEDLERVQTETSSSSLLVKKIQSTDGGSNAMDPQMMMQMIRMMGSGPRSLVEPSAIMWLEETDASDTKNVDLMTVEELKRRAVEITILDGMSRDDIREMLLALLPKRK